MNQRHRALSGSLQNPLLLCWGASERVPQVRPKGPPQIAVPSVASQCMQTLAGSASTRQNNP